MVEICRNSSLINKEEVIFAIAFSFFLPVKAQPFVSPSLNHMCVERDCSERVKADLCQKEHPDSMESSSSFEGTVHACFLDLPLPLNLTGSMPRSPIQSREYVC